MEAPRTPHLSQDSNPKAILVPFGGIAEISATINGLKEAGIVISSPFNWAVWSMQKADGPWRMTVDYCKCNQMVTPMAVAGPNEVSLLEQVNTALGSWCELPTWQMLFPQECKDHQKPEVAGLQSCLGRHQLSRFLPSHRPQRTLSEQSTQCHAGPTLSRK